MEVVIRAFLPFLSKNGGRGAFFSGKRPDSALQDAQRARVEIGLRAE
jgi:hypothetical protein